MRLVLAALLLLVACSKSPPPAPDATAAGSASSAKPPPPAGRPLVLRIERSDTRFEVSGEVPDGELPPALMAATKDYPGTQIKLKQQADPSAADRSALTRIGDAVLLLASGMIEVTPATVDVVGKVRTEEDKAAMTAALADAARHLGRKNDNDISVDLETYGPGEGFIRRADGATLASLKLSLQPIAGGAPLTPDSAGRIAAGLYTVKLGERETTVAVAEGKTTWLPTAAPKSLGVLIGGKRFALDLDVPLIAPGDEGALDATLAKSPEDMPLYGLRYLEPGKPLPTEEVLAQRDAIHQIILHADVSDDSAAAFKELVKNSLSDHFLIDWDGTIYQTLDVGSCAYHAGEANSLGIGVELNNLLPNLAAKPNASAYPKKHPRLAEMQSPAFARTPGPAAEINSAPVQTYTYTEAQYRSLGSLLRLLARVFPQLDNGPPMQGGEVAMRVINDPDHHRGVMAHWHWEAQHWIQLRRSTGSVWPAKGSRRRPWTSWLEWTRRADYDQKPNGKTGRGCHGLVRASRINT